jgi:hypothetical protein
VLNNWEGHVKGGGLLKPIEQLERYGDPLEKGILTIAFDEFCGLLEPYAGIWSRYIVAHRIGDGSHVNDRRMNFASSHYSALIRIHNAWGALQRIRDLTAECISDSDGAALLNLQASTASFWWALGSAVDNLGQAVEAFPGSTLTGQDAGKKFLAGKVEYLGYLYDRRTQQVHSRIVPIGAAEGCSAFDYRYMDRGHRSALPKHTEWTQDFNSPKDLEHFYDERWHEAKRELSRAWWAVTQFLDEISGQPLARQQQESPSWQTANLLPALTSVPASGWVGPRPPLE